jgi:hypothetical protein
MPLHRMTPHNKLSHSYGTQIAKPFCVWLCWLSAKAPQPKKEGAPTSFPLASLYTRVFVHVFGICA